MFIKAIDKEIAKKTDLHETFIKIGFSRLNLIVGENNSGKSRLIREMFRWCAVEEKEKRERLVNIMHNINSLIAAVDAYTDIGGTRGSLCSVLKMSDKVSPLRSHKDQLITDLEDAIKVQASLDSISIICENNMAKGAGVSTYQEFVKQLNRLRTKMMYYERLFIDANYVPANRIIKPLSLKDEQWEYSDLIGNRIFFEYFSDMPHLRRKIFSGQTLYSDLLDLVAAPIEKRELLQKYSEFLRDNFFNGNDVEINVDHRRGVVLFMVDAPNEHEIYNWGDSVQTVIALTFKPFIERDGNMIFFVEEPETHLHPSMQRKLVEVLLGKTFAQHQFFITTHSNHLLDISFDYPDMSVYLMRRSNQAFSIEQVKGTDETVFEILGVRSSSVLNVNCTIWVEGITDVIYYRYFLQRYFEENRINKYKEDLHYAFVMYGGSCIKHWGLYEGSLSESVNYRALTRKVFIIADSPVGGVKKQERHKNLEAAFGNQFHELAVTEVENLLPLGAINKYINNKCNDNAPLHSSDEYANVKLGSVLKGKKPFTKVFDMNDNINDKVKFAREMMEIMKDVPYLSFHQETQEICLKIHKFIEQCNNN